jgi:CP family cyanate transporter-like MFS transporter
MGVETLNRKTSVVALIVAVCLVGANMRPTITAVGPLLDQIGDDTGMATATLGFITAVPLITWALVSPLAHDLSRRFGMSRVVLWALVLLLLGTIVRSLPGPVASLWIGTALIGMALAIANVLMPATVKRDFPGRTAGMMALYTALLSGVGAISSGVAVPLSHLAEGGAGWRIALLITGGILLPFAIVAWALATRGTHPAVARRTGPRQRTGIWTDPVAWLVAAYMGLQSSVFYMMVTWLATISVSTGRSPVVAGFDVMIFQLFALAGSILLPLVLRGRAERLTPAVIPFVGIAGTLGLMIAPEGILVWGALLGLFGGSSLGMSLTLMAHRARDHDASAALSGMSQSVGYIVAAIGPVAFGALHAAVGGWTASLSLLLLVMVGLIFVGAFVGRERFVLDKSRGAEPLPPRQSA